jgi:hypothetical protein
MGISQGSGWGGGGVDVYPHSLLIFSLYLHLSVETECTSASSSVLPRITIYMAV